MGIETRLSLEYAGQSWCFFWLPSFIRRSLAILDVWRNWYAPFRMPVQTYLFPQRMHSWKLGIRTRLCSGEKGKKRGQIGKISASEASLAVAWGGGKGPYYLSASFADRFVFSPMLIFYSLFPQCGAWSQDNFHVTSIHVDRIVSFVLGEDQVQGRGHFVKR